MMKNGRFVLHELESRKILNFPIDVFFQSLGKEMGERSMGVILSGTGTDGSRGIKTIKETGGMIFCQDPETAQFDGMPRASIDTGLVDFVRSPKQLSEEICRIQYSREYLDAKTPADIGEEHMFRMVLNYIRKEQGIDFSTYKKNTLVRRLAKRFLATQQNSLNEYYDYLRENKHEVSVLAAEFLIGVTTFFRNPEAFKVLEETVLPKIFKGKNDAKTPIRIWVAACSTGEEAYSIAILFEEFIRKNNLKFTYKIFATDVDPKAIDFASAGSYSANNVSDLSEELLETYFIAVKDRFEVIKRIREKIVFSTHNLLADPPFIRVDMITCRNFLIYIQNEAQERVLSMFQFALNMNGFLFLGNSETLGSNESYFEVVDKKWRIYENISSEITLIGNVKSSYPRKSMVNPQDGQVISTGKVQPKRVPQDYVFTRYITEKQNVSCLFTDKAESVLYLSGIFENLMRLRSGVTELSLDNLSSKSLITLLRTTIRKAEESNSEVRVNGVVYDKGEPAVNLKVEVVKSVLLKDTYYIEMEESGSKDSSEFKTLDLTSLSETVKGRIETLGASLDKANYELQNVVEEMETGNEELQTSNEELMASNEELQSTNEELQSVNEELYTVNTELQTKNKQLSELNNDINNLLNSNNIATLFLDKDLCIRKFTPSVGRHFKLQEKDIGRPIEIFASTFSNQDQKKFTQNIKAALSSFKVAEFEIQDIDGFWYLCRTNPFVTDKKVINGVEATLTDISKLKATQADLLDRKNELSSIINNSPIGIASMDSKGRFLVVNPALEKFTGYSSNELIGKTFVEITAEEDLKKDQNDFQRLVSGEINVYSVQKRYIRKNGQPVWGALTVTKNERGNQRNDQYIGMVMDVSTIRKNQELIEANEQRFRMLFETMSEGFVHARLLSEDRKEVNWKFIDVNESFERHTGWQKKEVIGNSLLDIKGQNLFTVDRFKKECFEVAKTRTESTITVYVPKGRKWYSSSIFSPKLGEFAVTFRDITETKRAEKAIKEAIERAERSDRLKSAFLANMSHEIRTPMNSILGFAKLLKKENLDGVKQTKYVNIINQQGQLLLGLINDIVDISKIEANEIQMQKESFSVKNLVHQTIQAHSSSLKSPSVKFETVFIGFKNKDVLVTDRNRLAQILNNLVSNACKFTDEGYIKITCEKQNSHHALFIVEDSGMGISADEQENIFKRFYQVETHHMSSGTGLGLAISKGLVEKLGGEIWMESTLGKGAKFFFNIPIELVGEVEERTVPLPLNKVRSALKNKTILIAEDEEANFTLLEQMLSDYEVKILRSKDGNEALRMFKENSVDLVLMDIKLPYLNGLEATRAIRKIDKSTPIIAQTSYALNNEKGEILEAGCNGLVLKPIVEEELLKTIYESLKK